MITRIVVTCVLLLLFASCTAGGVFAAELRTGVQAGYRGGEGAELDVALSNFAKEFPLAIRVGLGYSVREAGKAADARKIFINDATNGTPEEHGSFLDYRFDLMYPFGWRSAKELYLAGGVRYSQSTTNFKFVGGNEDFDITSNQWGIGLGIEGYFAISQRLDFVVGGGIDYFFEAALVGHDTEYHPDGDNVNPHKDYTYSDADAAVNQPSINGRALIGLSYTFSR
jgi:hypothetical protein